MCPLLLPSESLLFTSGHMRSGVRLSQAPLSNELCTLVKPVIGHTLESGLVINIFHSDEWLWLLCTPMSPWSDLGSYLRFLLLFLCFSSLGHDLLLALSFHRKREKILVRHHGNLFIRIYLVEGMKTTLRFQSKRFYLPARKVWVKKSLVSKGAKILLAMLLLRLAKHLGRETPSNQYVLPLLVYPFPSPPSHAP